MNNDEVLMEINKSNFKVLVAYADQNKHTQREVATKTGLSLGLVNSIVADMKKEGLIDDTGIMTSAGLEVLNPFKVDNAIIMAAGMSSRFAPLSYEKPKALLNVKGEILIEREIRQLREAGIHDITMVVGYMKEKLYYLADKFNVKIVVNEDYYRFNNTSTLMCVLDSLKNTYICSSDNYFKENVFEKYVFSSYYAAVYADGKTEEYCLKTEKNGRIKEVTIGGSDAWYMCGHVYWNQEFSDKFKKILVESYNEMDTRTQLWENLYMKHLKELDLYIRKYPEDAIKEFDSLEELRVFDKDYLRNGDSQILKNISKILHCKDADIIGIVPIKSGLTNVSFKFEVDGKSYVYRHPGQGTEKYINRASEAESMQVAKELHLDDTFVYIDSKEGWKISRYIDNARLLDYENEDQVKQALKMIRKLHTSNMKTNCTFDFWKEIKGFYTSIKEAQRDNFEGIDELKSLMAEVKYCVEKDKTENCLCHCDCYNPNFLLDDNDNMYLIDWEYSGMCDPAGDIGTFIACSPYTMDQADKVIEWYLAHIPSKEELRHFLGYVAIASYYWFVWSLYQDCVGKPVGEWQYLWYKSSKAYAERAIQLYKE
jgi:hypothetical protein